MNLIIYIFNKIQKEKAKKYGVKINDFSNIDSNASIIIEETASLQRTKIIKIIYNVCNIKIGAHSYIRSGELISSVNIGRFCSIGRNVSIGLNPRHHPIDWISTNLMLCERYVSSPSSTDIGNDVWIGDGAVIMAGLKVGDGAIIGINAVVTKSVEPYQIVAGNPAKEIKYRFDSSIRDALADSKWWDKDLNELKKLDFNNIKKFLREVNEITKLESYKKIRIKNRNVFLL